MGEETLQSDATHAAATSSPPALPTLVFAVDRPRALMRSLWRLALAAAALAGAWYWDPHWSLLWRTQTTVFIALGTLWLLLAALGLALAWSGMRWLLLALWRGPLEIVVSPARVCICAPPFLRRELDGARLRVELDEGIDPDMLEALPDDAFLPHLRHPAMDEDLTVLVQRFSGLSSEQMTNLLRPYLSRVAARRPM